MRLIVAEAGSRAILCDVFLRRFGRSGRYPLLDFLLPVAKILNCNLTSNFYGICIVLNVCNHVCIYFNLPLETKALSYNFVARETTGKLFLEDKHFSLSMNNEFDLIFKSCSNRALFIRRSW